MNKLVQLMIEKRGFLSEGTAGAAIEALALVLQDAMASGRPLPIPGIGRFHVKVSAARNGYNLQTRSKVTIPAKPRVRFSAAPNLKAGNA